MYSTINDLLTGDLVISDRVDKQNFVEAAADEIDSILGSQYVTPIVTTGLADHSAKLLKKISNWLATGRLVLTLDIGGEDKSLHTYAAQMVKDALTQLEQIRSGQLTLVGAVATGTDTTNGPSIINHDASSGVDSFELFTRWHPIPIPRIPYGPPYWEPGPGRA